MADTTFEGLASHAEERFPSLWSAAPSLEVQAGVYLRPAKEDVLVLKSIFRTKAQSKAESVQSVLTGQWFHSTRWSDRIDINSQIDCSWQSRPSQDIDILDVAAQVDAPATGLSGRAFYVAAPATEMTPVWGTWVLTCHILVHVAHSQLDSCDTAVQDTLLHSKPQATGDWSAARECLKCWRRHQLEPRRTGAQNVKITRVQWVSESLETQEQVYCARGPYRHCWTCLADAKWTGLAPLLSVRSRAWLPQA